jgi:pyrroline-5-carboxylate reductase
MLADRRIALIGAGMMGEAMIAGLLDQQLVTPDQITATGPREERRVELRDRFGLHVTEDNRDAAEGADIIVFALKPQMLPRVLPTLRGAVHPDDLVLSIVAGTPIATIRDTLGHSMVVRAMPNTPAQIAEGMTVWTATDLVSEEYQAVVRLILGALGKEYYVADEKLLDAATALSGSGPAYCFLVLEAMVDAGVQLGFPRRVAEQIVLQTMHGSTLLAMQSGKHLAEMRNAVTSPGGTTAAALRTLERGGLRTVLSDGVWAAYERATELGK